MTTAENIARVSRAIKRGDIELTVRQIKNYCRVGQIEAVEIRNALKPEIAMCICGEVFESENELCHKCTRSTERRRFYEHLKQAWEPGFWRRRPDLPFAIDVEHF